MRMRGCARHCFRPFCLFYIKQLALSSNTGQSSLLRFLSDCILWECLPASHSSIAPPIRHVQPLLAMSLLVMLHLGFCFPFVQQCLLELPIASFSNRTSQPLLILTHHLPHDADYIPIFLSALQHGAGCLTSPLDLLLTISPYMTSGDFCLLSGLDDFKLISQLLQPHVNPQGRLHKLGPF